MRISSLLQIPDFLTRPAAAQEVDALAAELAPSGPLTAEQTLRCDIAAQPLFSVYRAVPAPAFVTDDTDPEARFASGRKRCATAAALLPETSVEAWLTHSRSLRHARRFFAQRGVGALLNDDGIVSLGKWGVGRLLDDGPLGFTFVRALTALDIGEIIIGRLFAPDGKTYLFAMEHDGETLCLVDEDGRPHRVAFENGIPAIRPLPDGGTGNFSFLDKEGRRWFWRDGNLHPATPLARVGAETAHFVWEWGRFVRPDGTELPLDPNEPVEAVFGEGDEKSIARVWRGKLVLQETDGTYAHGNEDKNSQQVTFPGGKTVRTSLLHGAQSANANGFDWLAKKEDCGIDYYLPFPETGADRAIRETRENLSFRAQYYLLVPFERMIPAVYPDFNVDDYSAQDNGAGLVSIRMDAIALCEPETDAEGFFLVTEEELERPDALAFDGRAAEVGLILLPDGRVTYRQAIPRDLRIERDGIVYFRFRPLETQNVLLPPRFADGKSRDVTFRFSHDGADYCVARELAAPFDREDRLLFRLDGETFHPVTAQRLEMPRSMAWSLGLRDCGEGETFPVIAENGRIWSLHDDGREFAIRYALLDGPSSEMYPERVIALRRDNGAMRPATRAEMEEHANRLWPPVPEDYLAPDGRLRGLAYPAPHFTLEKTSGKPLRRNDLSLEKAGVPFSLHDELTVREESGLKVSYGIPSANDLSRAYATELGYFVPATEDIEEWHRRLREILPFSQYRLVKRFTFHAAQRKKGDSLLRADFGSGEVNVYLTTPESREEWFAANLSAMAHEIGGHGVHFAVDTPDETVKEAARLAMALDRRTMTYGLNNEHEYIAVLADYYHRKPAYRALFPWGYRLIRALYRELESRS